jgi:Putative transposase
MTLQAGEFIRRFLMHTLPNGFHRIRQYGLLANGHRPHPGLRKGHRTSR